VNERAWQIEADVVPNDLGEAADLWNRLVENGESPATANGVIGWLLEKKELGRDSTAKTTRSRYRKALAKLVLSGNLPRHYSGVAQLAQVAA
jgi:hypothetical protein